MEQIVDCAWKVMDAVAHDIFVVFINLLIIAAILPRRIELTLQLPPIGLNDIEFQIVNKVLYEMQHPPSQAERRTARRPQR